MPLGGGSGEGGLAARGYNGPAQPGANYGGTNVVGTGGGFLGDRSAINAAVTQQQLNPKNPSTSSGTTSKTYKIVTDPITGVKKKVTVAKNGVPIPQPKPDFGPSLPVTTPPYGPTYGPGGVVLNSGSPGSYSGSSFQGAPPSFGPGSTHQGQSGGFGNVGQGGDIGGGRGVGTGGNIDPGAGGDVGAGGDIGARSMMMAAGDMGGTPPGVQPLGGMPPNQMRTMFELQRRFGGRPGMGGQRPGMGGHMGGQQGGQDQMRQRIEQWMAHRGMRPRGMDGGGPRPGMDGGPGGPGVAGGGDWNRPMPGPDGSMGAGRPNNGLVNPYLSKFSNPADYDAAMTAWNAAGGGNQGGHMGQGQPGPRGGGQGGGLPPGPGQAPVGGGHWGFGGSGMGMQGILQALQQRMGGQGGGFGQQQGFGA